MAKSDFDRRVSLMFFEILKASKGLYTDNIFAEMWGKRLAGQEEWQVTEITGYLPLTFLANGDVLQNYRIYGTASGSGVETENLLNDALATNQVPIVSGGVETYAASDIYSGVFIPVQPSTTYTGWNLATSTAANNRYVFFCDSNKNILGHQQYSVTSSPKAINTTADTAYICVPVTNTQLGVAAMVTEGATEPETFIPYGYQIPLTVTSGQNTDTYPLYIGDTKLGAEEYVDYASGKIYRTIGLITSDGKDFITADNNRFCVRRNNNG